jgi:purine-binding chemotaxis protein CheW
MPPFVSGGAVIRGEPVPVVDLGALVAGAAAEAPRRFVLLRLGERHAALAADAVVGVAQLAQGASAGASVLSGAAAGAVELLGALDGELLLVLRAATIVPEGAWEALRALPGAA